MKRLSLLAVGFAVITISNIASAKSGVDWRNYNTDKTQNKPTEEVVQKCEEMTPRDFGPINTFDASKSDTKLTMHMNTLGSSEMFPGQTGGMNGDIEICELAARDLADVMRKLDQATTNCVNSSEYVTNNNGTRTVFREENSLKRSKVLNGNQSNKNGQLASAYTTSFLICKTGNNNACVAGIKIKDDSSSNATVEFNSSTGGIYSRTKSGPQEGAKTTK